jgi:crotonobetainyl-CoA:carnitine CoA-transferase CaiB-like acyl-CoA transferase
MKALEGLRVLDLTHALSGPFCTYHLGLLGADIVKIERPGVGDDFRAFVREPGWDVGSAFAAVNAGKRSITVNLKSPEGREIIRRLALASDVMVENQRPGALAEMGIGHEELRAVNPKLITCTISGFGQDGDMASWPAYDHTIQAMTGMAWTGEADDTPSQGRGFSIDCFSGYVAHSAILSALVRRGRTGEGQHLDVAMLDSTLVLMGVGLVRQIISGDRIKATQPIVQDRPTVGPFRTVDGWLWLSGNFQNHWEALCRVLDAPDLLADPRFTSGDKRLQHKDELRAELSRRIAPLKAADLEVALMQAGAPAARVRTSRDALAMPALRDRRMLQDSVTPDGKPLTLMNAGFVADADGPALQRRLPGLGEHTSEVLAEIGYGPEDIERLRQAGAV